MIGAFIIVVPLIIAMYALYRAFVHDLMNPYVPQQHSRFSIHAMKTWFQAQADKVIEWRVHRAALVMSKHAKRHRAKALAAQQDSEACESCCVTKTLGLE